MKIKSHISDRICNFFSPSQITIGARAANQVGRAAKFLGAEKALIITDRGVVKAGLVEVIQESLHSENVRVDIFDGVEPASPAPVIDECAKLAREGGYHLVVGVGGGSSLDTTKGVSIMATNKGKVLDYAGMDLVSERGIPKILVPTTGSGSEVTRVFAPTDEADKSKKVVYSNFNFADIVIVDPLLTISLPPDLTADIGIDALASAIEPYVSVNATPFSDILASEAIRLISENLPVAFAKGDVIEARSNMSLAAIMANLAWQSGGLGAVHGLSYPLETEYNLSHGRACSVMLPHVLDYNKIGSLAKYGQISSAMGEHIEGLSAYEAAERAISAVKKLLNALDISSSLADYGVTKEGVSRLVSGAIKQARLFMPNPRNLAEEDVEKIYLKALE